MNAFTQTIAHALMHMHMMFCICKCTLFDRKTTTLDRFISFHVEVKPYEIPCFHKYIYHILINPTIYIYIYIYIYMCVCEVSWPTVVEGNPKVPEV